jgi:hypothetical protein
LFLNQITGASQEASARLRNGYYQQDLNEEAAIRDTKKVKQKNKQHKYTAWFTVILVTFYNGKQDERLA